MVAPGACICLCICVYVYICLHHAANVCHMGLLTGTCVSSGVQYMLAHPGRSRVVWGFGAPRESLRVLGATDWVLHMHWLAR